MITARHLIELLSKVPPRSKVSAYEGEDTGLNVDVPWPDSTTLWISAKPNEEEQDQSEFLEGVSQLKK